MHILNGPINLSRSRVITSRPKTLAAARAPEPIKQLVSVRAARFETSGGERILVAASADAQTGMRDGRAASRPTAERLGGRATKQGHHRQSEGGGDSTRGP